MMQLNTNQHPLLERRLSNIQNAQYGVFATTNIPSGTVLFTYAAQPLNTTLDLLHDRHYTFEALDADGKPQRYVVPLYDLGGFINDTVDFRPLNVAESMTLFNGKAPLTQYKHNCRYSHDTTTKQMFITAIEDIKPDQELFVDYGVNYWIPRYITSRLIRGIARATPAK